MDTAKSDTPDLSLALQIPQLTPQQKLQQYGSMHVTGAPGELMSYDPSSQEGAMMHIQATLGEVPDLASLANQEIQVRDFLIHDASSTNAAGEVETWKRIVIFDKDGKPYSCGSTGVGKSLAVMFAIRGMMPWNPPVKCKVVVTKLSNKNNWMILMPDMDSLIRANKPSSRR